MSDPNAEPQPQPVVIGGKTYFARKRRDGAGMELVRALPDQAADFTPPAEERRTAAVQGYPPYRGSPRVQPETNVTQPLPQRTQTILSHCADDALQSQLNGGISNGPLNRGRRHP